MRTLLTSCYPNLVECAKNYSGIKTLTVFPHDLRVSVKYNLVRVVFDTYSKVHTNKLPTYRVESKADHNFFLTL